MNSFVRQLISLCIIFLIVACGDETETIIVDAGDTDNTVLDPCNGDTSLCNKRYDELIYVTTHNAFNYAAIPENPDSQSVYIAPNQDFPIGTQLSDGVRAFMIDVYLYDGQDPDKMGQPYVFHTAGPLGNEPLADILTVFRDYLEENPHEVVTIILECYISSDLFAEAVDQAGLNGYLHSQSLDDSWPTLGEMIAADQRLVIFSDCNDGADLSWYHYVWDHAVETHFSNSSRQQFDCSYNRGDAGNTLFILNHFVTTPVTGFGIEDSSAAVNSNPYLLGRINECQTASGKTVNFLTVDYYAQGDVFEAVNLLNGVGK